MWLWLSLRINSKWKTDFQDENRNITLHFYSATPKRCIHRHTGILLFRYNAISGFNSLSGIYYFCMTTGRSLFLLLNSTLKSAIYDGRSLQSKSHGAENMIRHHHLAFIYIYRRLAVRHGACSLKTGTNLLISSFWACRMHSVIHTKLRISCSLSLT